MCVMSSKKMAIAMFGQKRLSREGGIEIVVKELCTRMAKNGYTVTCYNRSGHHVKSTQRFYIAFHLEDHPEEEYPVDLPDESMMSFGEPKSYLTFDDVRRLTGLSKKELKKKLKEKQIVAMYDEDAIRQAFDEDIC